MDKRILLSRFALCGTFFALGVIALGAITRLLDAGLGCPDWPGCYGQIVPANAGYKAWAEMIHRYFVGGLSLFIVSIIIMIFSLQKLRIRANILCATGLILLLVYQIMLGRWTVTLKLLPIIVTQHLLGGFFILTVLWLIYLNNKKSLIALAKIPYAISLGAYVGLGLLLLQIFLGAWTSTNYASLSCSDFPFCNNTDPLTPLYFRQAFDLSAPIGVNYEGGVLSDGVRQTIQMVHRMGALIVTLYWFMFVGLSLQALKNQRTLINSLYAILGLVLLQVCIGITNVIYKLPLFTAVAHNLVAVVLILTIVTFIFKLRKVSS